ncbi:MAG: AIR synthase family protein [bacterium]|nr:AIR synthase family protein [bacterium]
MNVVGKVASTVFHHTIYPKLGVPRADVLVGPRIGTDAAILQVDERTVLTLTTDPIFLMKELGWEKAVWFAVHILVSDSVTTAIPPSWIALDLNLPLELTDNEFEEIWEHIHQICTQLNLSIVTGHTGRYEGCSFPTIGSGTVIGKGSIDQYITPQMVEVGDVVLMTKYAAIETTAFLGNVCFREIAADCGVEVAQAAKSQFNSLSVVQDATLAVTVGIRGQGITSMHDATERGIQNAITEVAEVAQKGMLIYREEIPILECTKVLSNTYNFDPYIASSEGTLILTCKPQKVKHLLSVFQENGIPCTEIGKVVPKKEGVFWVDKMGIRTPIETPLEDPFWSVFVKIRNRS